jgi:hypothetical protein
MRRLFLGGGAQIVLSVGFCRVFTDGGRAFEFRIQITYIVLPLV